MKVLILAGGYATRLMPLSKETPKPLLQVGDKAIIDYILDAIEDIQVDGIFVLTNRRFSGHFERWREKARFQTQLIVEDSSSEVEKPGAIAAISNAMRQLGDDEYTIIAGDNLFDAKLSGMFELFNRMKAPVVGIYDVREPALVKMYSTVVIDGNNRIIRMREKPTEPETTLMVTCIYIFPKGMMYELESYLLAGGNMDSPGHFIEWLSKRREVYGYLIRGKWFDIGTPETYEKAKMEFQQRI